MTRLLHLSVDPGARHLGYALTLQEGDSRTLMDSGRDGIERGEKEPFQVYRKRLIAHWVDEFAPTLEELRAEYTDILVTFETLPGQGGGNFSTGGAVQTELAKTAATACQAMCDYYRVEWQFVSAATVKKVVAGNSKATKVAMRNAVIRAYPHLEERKKDLTGPGGADEVDAIALGLWVTGFRHKDVER